MACGQTSTVDSRHHGALAQCPLRDVVNVGPPARLHGWHPTSWAAEYCRWQEAFLALKTREGKRHSITTMQVEVPSPFHSPASWEVFTPNHRKCIALVCQCIEPPASSSGAVVQWCSGPHPGGAPAAVKGKAGGAGSLIRLRLGLLAPSRMPSYTQGTRDIRLFKHLRINITPDPSIFGLVKTNKHETPCWSCLKIPLNQW
jgi:hypothetical protein